MKIAAVCVTYNRPKLLGRMIRCFELQDHDDRGLIILDDAGQYGNRKGDRWKIVSVNQRFRTLGEKRNAASALVSADTEMLAVWDDDDIYLPWQLSAAAASLEHAQWVQPRQVLEELQSSRLTRHETWNRKASGVYGYPGGWSFRRGVIEAAGGYAPISNGEDADLAERVTAMFGPSFDTISPAYPTPGYVYVHRNTGSRHLSAMGPGNTGYEKRGSDVVKPVLEIPVEWPEDYAAWEIGDEVLPRRW